MIITHRDDPDPCHVPPLLAMRGTTSRAGGRRARGIMVRVPRMIGTMGQTGGHRTVGVHQVLALAPSVPVDVTVTYIGGSVPVESSAKVACLSLS
ncbi:hypothetical protein HHK36_022866 [Tetracentron sinense]|uniref:Uncharacterized protein n=1 Tax=Tetracentron sinense TaxID=13715 RepID=A0A835D6G9_TETSI|nr:hypothetical protein HHK36_022866 [Tetracentron sinense]